MRLRVFRVQGSGFRVWICSSGFRVQGSGFRVWICSSGFRVQGLDLLFRVQARVQGWGGFRVWICSSGFRRGFRVREGSGFGFALSTSLGTVLAAATQSGGRDSQKKRPLQKHF
jgi:phosphoserine phosphatase